MKPSLALPLLVAATACTAAPSPSTAPAPATAASMTSLESEVRSVIRAAAGDTAEVSVAFMDLQTGDSLLVDAHVRMHAASTMKVPVMMELFRRREAGELSMDRAMVLRNAFTSIADGQTYSLSAGDDRARTHRARCRRSCSGRSSPR